jgi:hypothetical protein
MTAPSIITDAEAARLAKLLAARILGPTAIDLRLLAKDGRIGRRLTSLAVQDRNDAAHSREFLAILRYVSHHGERGPQASGYVVTVTPPGYWDHRLDEKRCQKAASLDEARAIVVAAYAEHGMGVPRPGSDDPLGSCETVKHFGPLPDGSTITVERVPGWGDR